MLTSSRLLVVVAVGRVKVVVLVLVVTELRLEHLVVEHPQNQH
jgi:hypothetical protein